MGTAPRQQGPSTDTWRFCPAPCRSISATQCSVSGTSGFEFAETYERSATTTPVSSQHASPRPWRSLRWRGLRKRASVGSWRAGVARARRCQSQRPQRPDGARSRASSRGVFLWSRVSQFTPLVRFPRQLRRRRLRDFGRRAHPTVTASRTNEAVAVFGAMIPVGLRARQAGC